MRQLTIDDLHRLILNQAADPKELEWWKEPHAISARLQLDAGNAVEDQIVRTVLGTLTYRNREQIRRLLDRLAQWPGGGERKLDLLSYWSRIGEKYFDFVETFYVKPSLFETWRRQMHAADEDLPALAWLATVHAGRHRGNPISPELLDQWPTFIRGNDPQLYREMSKGFGCLHLHLSGAYPAPYFWVGLMNRRFDEKAFETIAADSAKLRGYRSKTDLLELKELISLARVARSKLFKFVQGRTDEDALKKDRGACLFLDGPDEDTPKRLDDRTDYAQNDLQSWSQALCPSLFGERYLLLRVMRSIGLIEEGLAQRLSRLLWAYLVAKHRFLGTVQQAEGIAGFDYFEHTFRLLRWRTDSDDSRCGEEIGNFLQESRGLVKLELMIAPRDDPKDYRSDVELATAIHARLEKRLSDSARALCGVPRVGLVVHFLKNQGEPLDERLTGDKHAYLAYHHSVRDRVVTQLDAISRYLNESGEKQVSICGIDAANRELYCPPEVFAEVFRRAVPELRRRVQGRRLTLGRTFHVGEDFVHLATGLRRIYEALVFLDLRPGDRLGHACALGVDPARWASKAQNVEMHLIDVLDDAVFEAVLLRESKPRAGGIDERRMSSLARLIDELCVAVFGATIPLVHLEKAWRMRADASRNGAASFSDAGSVPEWVRELHCRFPEGSPPYHAAGSHSLAAQVRGAVAETPSVPTDTSQRIAVEYHHDIRTIRRFLRTRDVDTTGAAGHLATLQTLVAEEANRRGVVVESNPSSNWLIGGLESHVEIPAVRWLIAGGEETGRVPFTINPDDPTVFASSIENEYFMVFSAAVHSARALTRAQCLREIAILRERSLQASFLD